MAKACFVKCRESALRSRESAPSKNLQDRKSLSGYCDSLGKPEQRNCPNHSRDQRFTGFRDGTMEALSEEDKPL